MKKRILFIVSSLALIFLLLINRNNVKDWTCMLGIIDHRDVKGVWVNDMAIYISHKHDVNYCELLSESLDGNIDSFRKFVKIDFFDGEYAYDHSNRVCKVILSYTPNDLEKCLSNFNQKELEAMRNYLACGLSLSEDYSLSKDDVKKINNVMDKIEVKLNKKRC